MDVNQSTGPNQIQEAEWKEMLIWEQLLHPEEWNVEFAHRGGPRLLFSL